MTIGAASAQPIPRTSWDGHGHCLLTCNSHFSFIRNPLHVPIVLPIMRTRLHVIANALFLLSLFWPLTGYCATRPKAASDPSRTERAKVLMGTRATYCSAPRKADGRVDVEKLVDELVEGVFASGVQSSRPLNHRRARKHTLNLFGWITTGGPLSSPRSVCARPILWPGALMISRTI